MLLSHLAAAPLLFAAAAGFDSYLTRLPISLAVISAKKILRGIVACRLVGGFKRLNDIACIQLGLSSKLTYNECIHPYKYNHATKSTSSNGLNRPNVC